MTDKSENLQNIDSKLETLLKCPDCGHRMRLQCEAFVFFEKIGHKLVPKLNKDDIKYEYEKMTLYCEKCQYENRNHADIDSNLSYFLDT